MTIEIAEVKIKRASRIHFSTPTVQESLRIAANWLDANPDCDVYSLPALSWEYDSETGQESIELSMTISRGKK